MQQYVMNVEPSLIKEVDEIIRKEKLYSSRNEFIRDAVRSKVMDYYRIKALKNLPKQRGILKGKGKNLAEKDRERLAKELTPENSEQLFRHFGFR